MKRSKTNSIKVSNIAEVVKNKAIRNTTPFNITAEGEEYYLHRGEKISTEDFENMFPIQLLPIALKGANYDRTKNWIHGKKSY